MARLQYYEPLIASVAMPQRQSLPINERLERAAQLVLRSRIFYDIWIYFEGDTRADILDTMQEFSEFFRFDPHAHFVAFIVHTAALFEKRKDTINLPLLAKEVMPTSKMGGASPSQYPAEINALLDQAKPLASKVIILRNNLFGIEVRLSPMLRRLRRRRLRRTNFAT